MRVVTCEDGEDGRGRDKHRVFRLFDLHADITDRILRIKFRIEILHVGFFGQDLVSRC
jgi:hypothetical protein